jgi:hypothetical protein
MCQHFRTLQANKACTVFSKHVLINCVPPCYLILFKHKVLFPMNTISHRACTVFDETLHMQARINCVFFEPFHMQTRINCVFFEFTEQFLFILNFISFHTFLFHHVSIHICHRTAKYANVRFN